MAKDMFNTRSALTIGALTLLNAAFCVISFTMFMLTNYSCYNTSVPPGEVSKNEASYSTTEPNIATEEKLRIVSRAEWIASPPYNEPETNLMPIRYVIIAHTATEGCKTMAECVFQVRNIQTFHMESRNFNDIAYNFLVGGDGAVYEGRGWNKIGTHSRGYNKGSICIAFLGTFTKNPPPEKQLRAAQMLIAEGVRLRKLSSSYQLYGHRQLIASESPGKALFEIIKTWPHWSNESMLS